MLPGGPDGAAQHVGGRGQDTLPTKPDAHRAQLRGRSVNPQRLAFEERRELIRRVGVDEAQLQIATDGSPMLGDRLAPFRIRPDGIPTCSQLRCGEAQDLFVDLQRLLPWEMAQIAHKGDLIREARPVVVAPAWPD